MPTIKDVAKASGYSVCTVSKAISGKGYVSEVTRRKILKVVDEIGYHPNHLAVSLKTGRTNALALIVPDVMNPYFPRLEKYVEQYALERGYMVYLCNTNNSLEREKEFLAKLSEGRVDGVIITPCSLEHEHIRSLASRGIAYVYVNRHFEDDLEHCVRIDNAQGADECISLLLDAGCTRIGAVFQSFSNTSYLDRWRGMNRAFARRGLSPDKSLCLFDVDDFENAHVLIRDLLARPDRPDGLFGGNDMLAVSAYQEAYELGLRIPEDLSVVGYDNGILSDKIPPPLTTYYQPARESSRAAVDFVCDTIEGRTPQLPEALRGRMVIRSSVRGVSADAAGSARS